MGFVPVWHAHVGLSVLQQMKADERASACVRCASAFTRSSMDGGRVDEGGAQTGTLIGIRSP